jgi:hypothetical protein
MAGNITSAVSVLQSITLGSYTFSWSGTSPIGTISLEGSDDYSVLATGAVNNAGTWTVLPLLVSINGGSIASAQSAAVTGNSGTGFIEWSTGAYALRVVYTATSGTGTISGIYTGKVA